MTQMKNVYQAVQDDTASTHFTQADGAITTWPLGQAVVSSGSPVVVSNQASLPAGARYGITHSSADVFVRAKAVSKAGESVYARRDATGYYFAANKSAGTVLSYMLIAGSVETVLIGPITGNAANDILGLEVIGGQATLMRNGQILGQVAAPNSPTAKEHGIVNPTGSTVLMDDLIIQPVL